MPNIQTQIENLSQNVNLINIISNIRGILENCYVKIVTVVSPKEEININVAC